MRRACSRSRRATACPRARSAPRAAIVWRSARPASGRGSTSRSTGCTPSGRARFRAGSGRGDAMEMTREELASLVEAHLDDRFHDECGVVGVHGHAEAAKITYLGLYALQHRGQESAGIVSNPGAHRPQAVHRGMGLVADVFNERILEQLEGRNAIGHVRYSTAGGSSLVNAQPFCATTDAGPIAIAHNGNLVNAFPIRRELEGRR